MMKSNFTEYELTLEYGAVQVGAALTNVVLPIIDNLLFRIPDTENNRNLLLYFYLSNPRLVFHFYKGTLPEVADPGTLNSVANILVKAYQARAEYLKVEFAPAILDGHPNALIGNGYVKPRGLNRLVRWFRKQGDIQVSTSIISTYIEE